MKPLNCTYCGEPIILVPSAEERAKKDCTGKSARYYRNLFTIHTQCQIDKRSDEALKLMKIEKVNYAHNTIPHNDKQQGH